MILLIRLGLSLAILAAIFWHVELSSVFRQFDSIDPGSLLAALLLAMSSTFLAAIRWRLITRCIQGNVPGLRFFVASSYRGALLNQGVPSTLGGDLLRVFDLARELGSKRKAFASVLFDRMMGLLSLLAINVLALPFGMMLFPASLALAIAGLSAVALILPVVALALPLDRVLRNKNALDMIADLRSVSSSALTNPMGFFLQCLISITAHISAFLAMFLIVRSLGIDVPFWSQLVIQPLVNLAMLLPFSLAGWGVREGTMVGLFAVMGIDAPPAMAASLTFGGIYLLSTLPGLLFLLNVGGRAATK